MERLTTDDNIAEMAIREMVSIDMQRLSRMYHRLRLYENTGITPDQFQVINEEYQKMAKELAELRQQNRWIPVTERLPMQEEYLKDDGRFILDDGNRRYQGLFDIYDGKFKFSKHISGLHYEFFEDNCVIAWQPLPEPYKE